MSISNALPLIVRIHANRTALSYVVTGRVEGEERIVSFGCKRLNQRQQKWSVHVRNFRAMVYAVRANAQLLEDHDYIIESEYRPLQRYRAAIAYYWQSRSSIGSHI